MQSHKHMRARHTAAFQECVQVVEFLHVKPGKGAAFVRSKLRNMLTGGVVEKTFRTNESLSQVCW